MPPRPGLLVIAAAHRSAGLESEHVGARQADVAQHTVVEVGKFVERAALAGAASEESERIHLLSPGMSGGAGGKSGSLSSGLAEPGIVERQQVVAGEALAGSAEEKGQEAYHFDVPKHGRACVPSGWRASMSGGLNAS